MVSIVRADKCTQPPVQHITHLTGHVMPQDDAPGVRLEAINLLGKYIGGSKDLEVAYYDIVAASLGDSAVSVRKAALRLLWEAYVMEPESGKANEACQLILQLATDNQDSNREMVIRLIRELWFVPTGEQLWL